MLKNQKVEDTQMSTDRRIGKQNLICTYHGGLLSLKRKDILIQDAMWMKLKNITLSEISQLQKHKCYMILLHKLPKQSNSQRQEIRQWLSGAKKGQCREVLFNG